LAAPNAYPRPRQPFETAINVDLAVLDVAYPRAAVMSPSWRTASLKDRVDAIIAHEYEESQAPVTDDHQRLMIELVLRRRPLWTNATNMPCAVPRTPTLKITEKARQILREIAARSR